LKNALARGVVWALFALLLGAHTLPAQSYPNPPAARAELLENGAYSGTLLTRLREAKRRIICVFYLFKVGKNRGNLPAAIAAELVRARQRGVEVKVILEGGKSVGNENLAVAGILLRGGVSVLFPRRNRVTHAKAVVIDDRYVLLGSHNLTQSALAHNNELSLMLDSPELAAQLNRYLEGIH
jgi:phosphatidylserine/phosphatidylglycerophosphate/cardiolipin synthase-like enzyme